MKKGFTMIELIFVIVILGILAAIAIPKLTSVKGDAEGVKAATNLTTLINELTVYYVKNSDIPANPVDSKAIAKITNVPGLEKSSYSSTAYELKMKVGSAADCFKIKLEKSGTLTITPKSYKLNEADLDATCKHAITKAADSGILSVTTNAGTKTIDQTTTLNLIGDEGTNPYEQATSTGNSGVTPPANP